MSNGQDHAAPGAARGGYEHRVWCERSMNHHHNDQKVRSPIPKSRSGMTTDQQLSPISPVHWCGPGHERPTTDDGSSKTLARYFPTVGQGVGFSQVDEADGDPLIGVILANLANMTNRALHTLRVDARAPRPSGRTVPPCSADAADRQLLLECEGTFHLTDERRPALQSNGSQLP